MNGSSDELEDGRDDLEESVGSNGTHGGTWRRPESAVVAFGKPDEEQSIT